MTSIFHRSTPGPLRVWFREITYYRRIWKANVLAAFVQPVLYLLGVGIGVGALVDAGPTSTDALGGVSYFAFYATALLATTAMFTASQEALWPTLDGFMWSNAYRAMVSTPIEPGDVATGLAIHHATRTMIGATGRRGRARGVFRHTLVGADPGDRRRDVVRDGVRLAARRVDLDTHERPVVPDDPALRDRPDVPLRWQPSSRSRSSPIGCSRSRGSPRCGTASSCAEDSCSEASRRPRRSATSGCCSRSSWAAGWRAR